MTTEVGKGRARGSVRHTRAFCSCSNGTFCKEQALNSKPGGRNAKGLKNLERRQRLFDDTRADDRRRLHHTKRPGSINK